ncbi:hypothetical protein [Streptomyces sp. S816]|nr:hypothetical protein [Streptomyces sp. S816]
MTDRTPTPPSRSRSRSFTLFALFVLVSAIPPARALTAPRPVPVG